MNKTLPKDLEGRLDEILDKYKVIGVALEPWEVPDMGLSAKTAQEEFKQSLTHLIEAYGVAEFEGGFYAGQAMAGVELYDCHDNWKKLNSKEIK